MSDNGGNVRFAERHQDRPADMSTGMEEGLMEEGAGALLSLQARIFESMARRAGLDQTLRELCQMVESWIPGSICSIMLLDNHGVLNVRMAPSVCAELINMLDGLVPSELSGSCGTAVFLRQPVYVCDTFNDPRWQSLGAIARDFEIRACWSIPILSRNDDVLGSFAISHAVCREPGEFDKQLLQVGSYLAGIAIDQQRTDIALSHSQKLESIGVLASGLAHDFNNLLVGILGNAQIAMSFADKKGRQYRALQSIVDAGDMAADLTRELLTYAGKGKAGAETLNLARLARDILSVLQGSMLPGIRLELDEDAWLTGDSGQIKQILMNLLMNAVESAADGRENTIALRTGRLYASRALLDVSFTCEELPEGNYVFIEVEDSGSGMDDDSLRRIFDPFYSTKSAGRGLGLTVCLGIIRAHQGCIYVHSQPGKGTEFRVLLPQAAEASIHQARSTIADTPQVTHPLTVIVIDDEPRVLEVMEFMLQELGYDVLLATSGE